MNQTQDFQPSPDAQAYAVPLEDLPEGVMALHFPAQGCSLEELAGFFGQLEGAIGEACGER